MPAEPTPPISDGILPLVAKPMRPPSANNALYGKVKQKSYIVLDLRGRVLAGHALHVVVPAPKPTDSAQFLFVLV